MPNSNSAPTSAFNLLDAERRARDLKGEIFRNKVNLDAARSYSADAAVKVYERRGRLLTKELSAIEAQIEAADEQASSEYSTQPGDHATTDGQDVDFVGEKLAKLGITATEVQDMEGLAEVARRRGGRTYSYSRKDRLKIGAGWLSVKDATYRELSRDDYAEEFGITGTTVKKYADEYLASVKEDK